VSQN